MQTESDNQNVAEQEYPDRYDTWKNKKSGRRYTIEGVAMDSEDSRKRWVVYKDNGTSAWWARPEEEFVEKFKLLDD
jgi:hypothetical protein